MCRLAWAGADVCSSCKPLCTCLPAATHPPRVCSEPALAALPGSPQGSQTAQVGTVGGPGAPALLATQAGVGQSSSILNVQTGDGQRGPATRRPRDRRQWVSPDHLQILPRTDPVSREDAHHLRFSLPPSLPGWWRRESPQEGSQATRARASHSWCSGPHV